LRAEERFVKRPLSFWAEEMIVVDPVGGLEVDGAIVRVQEWFIRPIDQDVW